ncbi:hypothetical protein [Thermomonospora curvata]|nr:hypothetical protein [Thermomonospora curvata]
MMSSTSADPPQAAVSVRDLHVDRGGRPVLRCANGPAARWSG